MNFENILILGKFIKRYKRFFADVKVNNNILKTHCPNTGSMMGLLNKGNRVWISKSGNPNRKLILMQQQHSKKCHSQQVKVVQWQL